MHAETHATGADYLRAAGAFHRETPLAREFVRGVAAEDERRHAPPLGYLLIRAEDGHPVVATCRTSPTGCAISDLPATRTMDAAAALDAVLLRPAGGPSVRHLFGPEASIDAVRSVLAAAGHPAEIEMELTGHRLETLRDPPAGPGDAVTLGVEHLELICRWAEAFAVETGVPGGADTPQGTRRRLEAGRLVGWRADGRIVAAASMTRRTPATGTIGFVWTPPEDRRAGHASRLVAAVSRRILDSGRQPVLYTNAADPIPNRLYHRLGFTPRRSFRSLALG